MTEDPVDTLDDLLAELQTSQTDTVEPAGRSAPSSEASSPPIDQIEPTVPLSEEDRLSALEARLVALEPTRPREVPPDRRQERTRLATTLRRHLDLLLDARTSALDSLAEAVNDGLPTRALVDALYFDCRRAYSLEQELYGRSIQLLRPAWLFPAWCHSLGVRHETLENPRNVKKVVVPLPDTVRDLLHQLDALDG